VVGDVVGFFDLRTVPEGFGTRLTYKFAIEPPQAGAPGGMEVLLYAAGVPFSLEKKVGEIKKGVEGE